MPLRILVTGFSPFPGTPVNPSEELVRLFGERRPDFGRDVEVEAILLATAYGAVTETLTAIGRERPPDVSIHFGLAQRANGFRLERIARNLVSSTSPDAAGRLPPEDRICRGAETIATALPLTEIHARLSVLGIPVEYSDSAGDYVCNFTFYSVAAGLIEGFSPRMCGFVHIPYLDSQLALVPGDAALPSLSQETLWRGAVAIVETCAVAARSRDVLAVR